MKDLCDILRLIEHAWLAGTIGSDHYFGEDTMALPRRIHRGPGPSLDWPDIGSALNKRRQPWH